MVLLLVGGRSVAEGFPAVKVYKKSSGSVVLIVSKAARGDSTVGAGSIVTDNGLVLTNAHVVIDKETGRPYSTIRVYIKPDEVRGNLSEDLSDMHGAGVLAYDRELDLAVLEMKDVPRGIGIIKLADPGEIMVGEEVVAIGHPEQGGLWTLTYGRISGQLADQSDVRGKDVFQTDTSLNRGNSGGPLLDRRGYLVGVNTNIARVGAGNMAITGVNFAVKASVVRGWLNGKGLVLAYGTEPLYEDTGPVEAEAEPERTEEPPAAEPTVKEPERIEEPPAAEPTVKEPERIEEPPAAEPTVKEPEEKMSAEATEEERMLTPKNPYSFDDLFKEVEKEMEDLMEDMRMKIRR
jgi:serine protease Do